jgi:hypothetical protein
MRRSRVLLWSCGLGRSASVGVDFAQQKLNFCLLGRL